MLDEKKKLNGEELSEASGGYHYRYDGPTSFTCAKCGRFYDLKVCGNDAMIEEVYKKYKANKFWCFRCGKAPDS